MATSSPKSRWAFSRGSAPRPDMSADDFIELCRTAGKGSLLWYDKDGADRPTWTALEMACLLRAGYRFVFGPVITLIPPARQ